MGGAMLSKSLIQFSFEGRAVFPPCYLTWGQTMVEVMKITVTSFKRSHAHTAALSAPSPAAGHRRPTPPLRLLDTHGQVWVSLLWGHCSFLLGPSVHKVLFVPSKSLFPQSCESSGCSMVGLMATSSKRAYATPRSAAPRAHATATVHCWPVPPHETVKHSSVQFLWGLLVLVHMRYVWALWASLVGMGFDSKHDFAPPTVLLRLLLCPWMLAISSQSLQHCTAPAPAPCSCHSGVTTPLNSESCFSFLIEVTYDSFLSDENQSPSLYQMASKDSSLIHRLVWLLLHFELGETFFLWWQGRGAVPLELESRDSTETYVCGLYWKDFYHRENIWNIWRKFLDQNQSFICKYA